MKEVYASLRSKWTPGRVIVALTALLAATVPAATAIVTTWLAANFPGLPPIDPEMLAGIFITTILGVLTPIVVLGFKRLDGQMQYERLVADPDSLTEEKILKSAAPPATGATDQLELRE